MLNCGRKKVGHGREREVGGREKGNKKRLTGKVFTLTDSM